MKKDLAHLPKAKQDELKLIVNKIHEIVDPEKIILFGSYARGDWKDGPHTQGKGRLTIHKKSDYDILVITEDTNTARDPDLWYKVKEECAKLDLSTHPRIIAEPVKFINLMLAQGRYFYKEIDKDGVLMYDTCCYDLSKEEPQTPEDQKQIAQEYYDEAFKSAESFYTAYKHMFGDGEYKNAAFQLHQATEHAYKAVLLVFTDEYPREHFLDFLGRLATHRCNEAFADIFPKSTPRGKYLLELLDYAYIGARYDPKYKITKEELEQLAPCVRKLHEVTERICKEKIDSFT